MWIYHVYPICKDINTNVRKSDELTVQWLHNGMYMHRFSEQMCGDCALCLLVLYYTKMHAY
jgi:hypothetical protein